MTRVDQAKAALARLRQRSPALDRTARTAIHYSDTDGNVLAGAVTYFGFLSVFPLLVIGFAVVGFVTGGSALATREVTRAIESVFPGLSTGANAPLDVSQFQDAAATASVIGVVTLLYTGLNWVGSLRTALQDVFTLPREAMPNFVLGKARDLVALVVLGVTLLVSVSLSTVVTSVTGLALDALGLSALPGYTLLLKAIGVALGVATGTLLFFVMYRMLPRPELPRRALLQGALLAAVAFELLKLVATYLIAAASQNPAAALAGTFVVLLVWINYFSRVTLLGACWAVTSASARQALPALRRERPKGAGDELSDGRSAPA